MKLRDFGIFLISCYISAKNIATKDPLMSKWTKILGLFRLSTKMEFLKLFFCHILGMNRATEDPLVSKWQDLNFWVSWCFFMWPFSGNKKSYRRSILVSKWLDFALHILQGKIKVIFTHSFHFLMWLFRNRICSKCEKVCYLASFSLCQRFLYVQNLNLFPFSSYFVGYYWDNPTLIVPIYKGKTMYYDKMRDGMMPTIHFWIHWEWNETG